MAAAQHQARGNMHCHSAGICEELVDHCVAVLLPWAQYNCGRSMAKTQGRCPLTHISCNTWRCCSPGKHHSKLNASQRKTCLLLTCHPAVSRAAARQQQKDTNEGKNCPCLATAQPPSAVLRPRQRQTQGTQHAAKQQWGCHLQVNQSPEGKLGVLMALGKPCVSRHIPACFAYAAPPLPFSVPSAETGGYESAAM